MTEQPIFLELYSGTKSMSKTAEEFGFKVFSIDIDESLSPSLCADILTIDSPTIIDHCGGKPDVIWASPDCTKWSFASGSVCEFTKANAGNELSEAAEEAIRMIEHTRLLIDELDPQYFFMENPFHGALKDMLVVANMPFVDVYYCAYDWPYQKKTRIWGRFPPQWVAKTTCSHARHENIKGYGNARLRSEIPVLLCREVVAACSLAAAVGWPQRKTLEDDY